MNSNKNFDDNYNNSYRGGEDQDYNDYYGDENGSVGEEEDYYDGEGFAIFEDIDCLGCFAVFMGASQFIIGFVSMAIGATIMGEIGFGYFMFRYNVGVPLICGFCYCIAGLVGMCICKCGFGSSEMTMRKKRCLYFFMCVSFLTMIIGIGHAIEQGSFAYEFRQCYDCFHVRSLLIASAMVGGVEAVVAFISVCLGCAICFGKFGDMPVEPSHKVTSISDNEFEDYSKGYGMDEQQGQQDDGFAYV